MKLLPAVQDDCSDGHNPTSLRTSPHFRGQSAIPSSSDHPWAPTPDSTHDPDEARLYNYISVKSTRAHATG